MAIARRHLQETSERPNPIAAVHSWRSPADSAVELILVTHLGVGLADVVFAEAILREAARADRGITLPR